MRAAVSDATHPDMPAVLGGAPSARVRRARTAAAEAVDLARDLRRRAGRHVRLSGGQLTPPDTTDAPDEASAYIVTFTIWPLAVQLTAPSQTTSASRTSSSGATLRSHASGRPVAVWTIGSAT